MTTTANWSMIFPGDDHFELYSSGMLLETYIRWTSEGVIFDGASIQYSFMPYKRLAHSLTGGLVTGNITFTYTNQTLRSRVNGINVVEHPTEGSYLPEPMQLFMNASLHLVPADMPVLVSMTSTCVVHLHASYDEYCGSLCGYFSDCDQGYLVRPGSGID